MPKTNSKDDPRWRGYDVPPKSNANYAWILNMVSKLSDHGVAGFILANGALSGGGEEYKIRKQLIENDLVEAIMVLPQDMFYTTNISVTLWILNKNKKGGSKEIGDETRQYRNRQGEILFMDLRQMGEPFEKKFTQFADADITKVVHTYHTWQTSGSVEAPAVEAPASTNINTTQSPASTNINTEAPASPNIRTEAPASTNIITEAPASTNINTEAPASTNTYQNIPEFCYSASYAEVAKKDFSLVPSKYIEFVNRDENIDFDEKMKTLKKEFADLLKAEAQSKNDLLTVFKELGYEIEL